MSPLDAIPRYFARHARPARAELMRRHLGGTSAIEGPLQRGEIKNNDRVNRLIDEVCKKLRTKRPAVVGVANLERSNGRVETGVAANYYAAFRPSKQALVLSEAASKIEDDNELKALIGHELKHKKHNLSIVLGDRAMFTMLFLRMPLSIAGPISGWITRAGEKLADRGALRVAGGKAVNGLFRRIQREQEQSPEKRREIHAESAKALWFGALLPKRLRAVIGRWMHTHPEIEDRISTAERYERRHETRDRNEPHTTRLEDEVAALRQQHEPVNRVPAPRREVHYRNTTERSPSSAGLV